VPIAPSNPMDLVSWQTISNKQVTALKTSIMTQKLCYTCKESFQGYTPLMEHRKECHTYNKVCRKFPGCPFENKCWYIHPEEMRIDEGQPTPHDIQLKCHKCGETFENKTTLMNHKKKDHPSNILCKYYMNSKCRRTSEQCWFNHYISPQPPNPANQGQTIAEVHTPVQPVQQVATHVSGSHVPSPPSPSLIQDFPRIIPSWKPPDQISAIMDMMNRLYVQMSANTDGSLYEENNKFNEYIPRHLGRTLSQTFSGRQLFLDWPSSLLSAWLL
jgi:hypothetical protein